MRKAVVAAVVFLGFAFASSTFADWSTPWLSDSEANLPSLINSGYEIINTGWASMGMGMGFMEAVYLKKDKKTYRCLTMQIFGEKESHHWCEICQQPKRNN